MKCHLGGQTHVLRMPITRPIRLSVERAAEVGKKRRGRPQKTRQNTVNEDLKEMELDWKDAKSVAGNRTKWRTLVAQCSTGFYYV